MAAPDPDPFRIAIEVGVELSRLGVPFCLAGSLASSIHGFARATLDADLVADMQPGQGRALAARLGGSYHADAGAMEAAIGERRSFNVIHLDTMFKVDVFVLGDGPFDRESFDRSRPETLGEPAVSVRVVTPEDTVLHKLIWYDKGGGVSERQWSDVIGVLRVQGDRIDAGYLRRWAGRLSLAPLLERAVAEAGRSRPGR